MIVVHIFTLPAGTYPASSFLGRAETLKIQGNPFTLMGNPFHLDDEVCKRLKDCGCDKYQMSLDGMRETHDWFRKPGSFDLTLEKVACINRAGIKSVIMSTVSKTNMREIPDIIDAVVRAKVKVFAFPAMYRPAVRLIPV